MSVSGDVEEEAGLSVVGQTFLARLSDFADGRSTRIYAVMDGACFVGLPSKLSAAGLSHRPLYRHNGPDMAVVLGGPWLVPLSEAPPAPSQHSAYDASEHSDEDLAALATKLSAEMAAAIANGDESGGGMLPINEVEKPDRVKRRIEAIVKLTEGKSGVVYWICHQSVTEDQIYCHLRGINRILVPKERDKDQSGAREITGGGGEIATGALEGNGHHPQSTEVGEGAGARHEAVVFRHADANVMVQVFPTLTAGQVARLMGPAEQIFFAPSETWGGGLKRGRRPVSAPSPTGHFCLTKDNVSQIRAKRLEIMRSDRAAYLKKCCPNELGQAAPESLTDHVLISERSGRELGLVSEAAHCRWAYLMFATRGQIATSPEVARYIRYGGADPDRQVDLVMKSTVANLKARCAGMGV